ncbi:MAG: alkaline phosphatase [Thermotogota bacterium]
MKKFLIFILLLFSISIFSSKYIFFFLGDGMGLNHLKLANEYSINQYGKDLNYLKLDNFSLLDTQSLSGVTDSSAAITAIMSLEKTHNDKINIDKNGNKLNPISYYFKDIGYNIAVITSNSIVDASPAGIYAKSNSRQQYSSLANQLLDSQFDLFIGGGRAFLSEEDIEKKGYDYKTKIDIASISEKPEVILTAYSNNKLIKDSGNNSFYKDTVDYGIQKFNGGNFFIFIEGGRIDHASHAHDSLSVIKETIAFDESLEPALNFYEQNPEETIILFLADHETGGLSLGDGFININNLNSQKYSYEYLINIINKSDNYEDFIKKTNLSFLTETDYNSSKKENNVSYFDDIIQNYFRKYNNASGIKWSSFGHTINNVPLFSNGIDYDNYLKLKDIFWKIIKK